MQRGRGGKAEREQNRRTSKPAKPRDRQIEHGRAATKHADKDGRADEPGRQSKKARRERHKIEHVQQDKG